MSPIDYAATRLPLNRDVSLFVDDEAGNINHRPVARELDLYLAGSMFERTRGGGVVTPPDLTLAHYVESSMRLSGKT